MANGYAGVPPGPLSAYLGVRQANEQRGLADLQGAGQMQGLLARMQAQQKAQQFQQEMGSADTPDKQIAVATKYGAPADIIHYITQQQTRKDTLDSQQAASKEAAQVRGQQQLDLEKQRALDREAQIRIAGGLRPAPAPSMVVVQDAKSPTGWSHKDARSGQLIPGAPPPPSVTKKTEKQEALDKGKNQVSEILGNLNAQYKELSTRGAISDTSKGTAYNVQRAIASSTPGQVAGRVLGTETQGIRNRINMTRPLLMNAIRQATGQSAKSLDSNVELQFYLQAATNPATDIQSNLAALDHLDKLYGLGIGVNADPAAVEALKKSAPKSQSAGKVLRFDANGNPLP